MPFDTLAIAITTLHIILIIALGVYTFCTYEPLPDDAGV